MLKRLFHRLAADVLKNVRSPVYLFVDYMLIGGLQKLTLIDYPGKVAAAVFAIGCNFRCGFCHNPELVNSELRIMNSELSEEDVLQFLKSRQGLLEAVVITGGEPTVQPDLVDFVKKVRSLGFLVKIDTNGANPEMIERLNQEKLVDFWAMDVKSSESKYERTAGVAVDLEKIKKSIELIKKNGVDYEFRSTLVAGLHLSEDVLEMAKMIEGAKKFVLQKFVSREKLVNQDFVGRSSFSEQEMLRLAEECRRWVEEAEVR